MSRLHAAEHPVFHDGRTIGVGENRASRDSEVRENLAQQPAVAIRADHAERAHIGAQRAHVCHHEAGVAGLLLATLHAQNRNRRFG